MKYYLDIPPFLEEEKSQIIREAKQHLPISDNGVIGTTYCQSEEGCTEGNYPPAMTMIITKHETSADGIRIKVY